MRYEPSWESLKQHPVPGWFHDAKLGVLVVWGLFSVPGWAPLTGDFDQVVREQGWETFFRENPYAEWYYNSIRFPDSPSRHYHNQTYGQDFDYDDFVAREFGGKTERRMLGFPIVLVAAVLLVLIAVALLVGVLLGG